MAGTDFTIFTSSEYRNHLILWSKYIQKFANVYNLEMHYRLKERKDNALELYVTLDGEVPFMVLFLAEIPIAFRFFRLAHPINHSVFKKCINPFVVELNEAVKRCLNSILQLSKDLARFRFYANPMALSPSLLEEILWGDKLSPDLQAVSTIFSAYRELSMGNISANSALVLCDQGVEEWMRIMTGSKKRYLSQLAEDAQVKGLINENEKKGLIEIHGLRCKVQHQLGKVTPEKVIDDIVFCLQAVAGHYLNSAMEKNSN